MLDVIILVFGGFEERRAGRKGLLVRLYGQFA